MWQTAQWKEALKILKLCVTRSSTLSAAPPTISTYSVPLLESTMLNLASHTSFAEAEVMVKKELPGLFLCLRCGTRHFVLGLFVRLFHNKYFFAVVSSTSSEQKSLYGGTPA